MPKPKLSTPRPRRVTVRMVQDTLRDVAAEFPSQVDRRAVDGLLPRYIDQGMPNCLVAMVLIRLGFSHGVLKALDHEHPTGDLVNAGVKIAETRHPALRKLDPLARQLLGYVQDQQDRGWRWGDIVTEALDPGPGLAPLRKWSRRRKPWLDKIAA